MECLRLIPAPDSKWSNWIGCALWMLTGIGSTVANSVLYYKDNPIDSANFAKQFAYIGMDIFQPFQSFCGILLIKLFVDKNRHQVTSRAIIPKNPWFFLTTMAFQLVSMVYYICINAPSFKDYGWIFYSLFLLHNTIVMLTFVLVLGVAANSFSKMIKNYENIVTLNNFEEIFLDIIEEFQGFKQHLQPMLFMLFLSGVILVTLNGYILIKDGYFNTIPYQVYLLLQMSYVTYTLDDCFNEFKSTLLWLR